MGRERSFAEGQIPRRWQKYTTRPRGCAIITVMFNLGPSELIVIFVVALLVFGPKKLPELGRSLGKGLAEFRRASAELRGSLEREMQTIEQETHAQETASQTAHASETPAPDARPEPHG